MTYEIIRKQLQPLDKKMVQIYADNYEEFLPLRNQAEHIATNYLLEQFGERFDTVRVGSVNLDGSYEQDGKMLYESLIPVEFDHHVNLSDETTLEGIIGLQNATTQLQQVYTELAPKVSIIGEALNPNVYCNDGSFELTIESPRADFDQYCTYLSNLGKELKNF